MAITLEQGPDHHRCPLAVLVDVGGMLASHFKQGPSPASSSIFYMQRQNIEHGQHFCHGAHSSWLPNARQRSRNSKEESYNFTQDMIVNDALRRLHRQSFSSTLVISWPLQPNPGTGRKVTYRSIVPGICVRWLFEPQVTLDISINQKVWKEKAIFIKRLFSVSNFFWSLKCYMW